MQKALPILRLSLTLFLGMALGLPCLAIAQNNGVGVEYVAPVRPANLGGVMDQEIGLLNINLFLVYPVVNLENTILAIGGGARARLPQSANETVDNFYEMTLQAVLVQRFARSWSAIVLLAPQLATDFNDVDLDHLRATGTLMLSYTFSDELEVGAGVAATYVFGEFALLPAVRLDWQILRSLRLNVLLPSRALFGWKVTERVEVGVSSRLAGNRYQVTSDLFQNIDQLVYTQADVGGFVDVRLGGPLWLAVWGGYTIYRNFELRDTSGQSLGDQDFANAPVVGVALTLRPD